MGTQFEDAGISFLNTRIVEREAFKGVVNFGATLADLTEDQVPGLDKARVNAAAFVKEIIEVLREARK
jgi:chromosome partitioning protein